jgi:DNA-binding SARP family transcriptional activator
MQFRLLGPVEVESEGALLPIGSRQPRALLAVLLLDANHIVSRDRLVAAVWGERPPERAANALQVYVSQLRKALGRDRIATQSSGYVIRVAEGELDVDRFERLVAEARGAEPALAARSLREALALWRGPPLGDLEDVAFAEAERRRLQELRLSAVEQRVDADLELGRHAELVPELESFVHEHPLRERPRGQLMLALYRSGRQAEALEVYRQARRLLQDELGLEPGDALKRLERSILAQDPALGVGPSAPPTPPPPQTAVPTGTVSFLFTDVEGSTRLVQTLGEDDYGALLEQHHALLRAAFAEHGGLEIDTQGDAFFFAFRRARDAVAGAVAAQRAFAAAEWPAQATVRIRLGIHTGEPGLAVGGYHGLDVVRAARISGVAHGGQILVSSATRDLVGGALHEVTFVDLGEHALKDIEGTQRIFQALAAGLESEFPPIRTAESARVMSTEGRAEELAAAAQAAVGAEERRLRVFHRSRAAAVIGALLLVGAVVGIVLALTGGGSAPVEVLPNSVAVVDPGGDRVVADIPVGKRPLAVAAGAGGIWVANGDDQTVMRIDPNTRKVVATIGIGADVSDIAVGYGSVWVADGNDGTVTQIDPKLNAVRDTIRFGSGSSLSPNPVFAVATGVGGVWITRGNRVVRIDPGSSQPTASFDVPSPASLAVGDGAVWITTVDERLLRLDPSNGKPIGSTTLPATGVSTVVGRDAVWISVELGNGQIWQVDPASMSPLGTTTSRVFPIALALAPGAGVWAAGAAGVLQRLGSRGGIVRSIRVGLSPQAVDVDAHGVWVAVQAPGSSG